MTPSINFLSVIKLARRDFFFFFFSFSVFPHTRRSNDELSVNDFMLCILQEKS
eukprot:m.298894 g.298894  ORF g.298894 m.298894 type:complete len:53 (+) comp15866_c0_seq10:4016-4174(+)